MDKEYFTNRKAALKAELDKGNAEIKKLAESVVATNKRIDELRAQCFALVGAYKEIENQENSQAKKEEPVEVEANA